eukprot:4473708-Prymnesium_polylepis.2
MPAAAARGKARHLPARRVELQDAQGALHRQGVNCSPHNPGARELAEELNGIWPGLLQVAEIKSWAEFNTCDHMRVYLKGQTWTHDPEPTAAE